MKYNILYNLPVVLFVAVSCSDITPAPPKLEEVIEVSDGSISEIYAYKGSWLYWGVGAYKIHEGKGWDALRKDTAYSSVYTCLPWKTTPIGKDKIIEIWMQQAMYLPEDQAQVGIHLDSMKRLASEPGNFFTFVCQPFGKSKDINRGVKYSSLYIYNPSTGLVYESYSAEP